MAIKFNDYPDRQAWLAGRRNSIGASEIASVLGIGFSTPISLWQEKTGRKQPIDLSGNALVSYGSRAEEYLRALFALRHEKEYTMEYHPYRVYYKEDTPFLTATLDGELTRLADGKRGIWENKTVWVKKAANIKEWEDRSIPDKYYCQLLQQLQATDFDFAVLNAEIHFPDGHIEIREYTVEWDEVENDITYIVEEGTKFWGYVKEDKQPPVVLTI